MDKGETMNKRTESYQKMIKSLRDNFGAGERIPLVLLSPEGQFQDLLVENVPNIDMEILSEMVASSYDSVSEEDKFKCKNYETLYMVTLNSMNFCVIANIGITDRVRNDES